MPLNLELRDVSSELEEMRSVLLVSCPVCPQISLAMQNETPWIELFESGLKTRALEEHIARFRESLEDRGVRTGAFTTRLPLPTMCLWTRGQRERLLERSRDYEAVVVLGCESATYTAQRALEGEDCRVIQGMTTVGITNAEVGYRFPATLELREKTRVHQGKASEEETHE